MNTQLQYSPVYEASISENSGCFGDGVKNVIDGVLPDIVSSCSNEDVVLMGDWGGDWEGHGVCYLGYCGN